MKIRRFLTFCAIVTMAAALVAPANAAFPGKNGRIAFIYGSGACGGGALLTGDLYTMNSDGRHVKRLTHFGPKFKTVVGYENWSPDGRKIVFVELAAGNCGGGQLWIMDSDGSHLPHRLLNDQGSVDTEPSFSPNGKMVVFSRVPSSYNRNNAIYRVNVDGTGLTAITHYSLGSRGDVWPEYSPDGKQIAFVTGRDGRISCTAVMNADGSNFHFVTPAWLGGGAPDWSPDGRGLVVDTYQHFIVWGQNEELWMVDLEGDGITRLTRNNFPEQDSYYVQPHDYTPSWSPDGTAIVFSRWNGPLKKWGLYIMRRRGANWATTEVTPRGFTTIPQLAPPSGRLRFARGANRVVPLKSGGAIPRWGTEPNIGGPDLGDRP